MSEQRNIYELWTNDREKGMAVLDAAMVLVLPFEWTRSPDPRYKWYIRVWINER